MRIVRIAVGAGVVHALLLIIAIAALAACVILARRGKTAAALWTGATAAGAGIAYFATDELPSQLVFTAPYVVTLLVLVFAAQRLRPPAAEGLTWRKGDVG